MVTLLAEPCTSCFRSEYRFRVKWKANQIGLTILKPLTGTSLYSAVPRYRPSRRPRRGNKEELISETAVVDCDYLFHYFRFESVNHRGARGLPIPLQWRRIGAMRRLSRSPTVSSSSSSAVASATADSWSRAVDSIDSLRCCNARRHVCRLYVVVRCR